MSLLNNNFIGFDGTPVTGQVPTQMIVYPEKESGDRIELTPALYSAVCHAYKQFGDAVRVSAFPSGYHVQNRQFPDGSSARFESNNGVQRAMVWPVGGGGDDELYPYMETGCFTNSSAFASQELRELPAKWRFGDIPTVSDWLGGIRIKSGRQIKRQPTPIDTHILRDNIDSLAIGYKRYASPESDAQSKEMNFEKMLEKKLILNQYPAGVFSGKFRLFMQAQYGAHLDSFRMRISVSGAGTTFLYYLAKDMDGGDIDWQLTHFSQDSVGLHTTPDFKYFALRIIEISGGRVQVKASPIVFNDLGEIILKGLRNTQKKGLLTKEIQRRVEAYLFTEGRIDAVNEVVAGEAETGPLGDTLEYGWKFNNDGSKLSIITHRYTGEPPNEHYLGREVHITLSRSEEGVWGVNAQVLPDVPWIDGTGSWHIFRPDIDYADGNLVCFSNFANGQAYRATATFSNAPVYGYYDKNDTWVAVRITQTAVDPEPVYDMSFDSLEVEPGVSDSDMKENFFSVVEFNTKVKDVDGGRAYCDKRSDIKRDSLSVGETMYNGELSTYRSWAAERVVANVVIGGPPTVDWNGVSTPPETFPRTNFFHGLPPPVWLPNSPFEENPDVSAVGKEWVDGNGPNTVRWIGSKNVTYTRTEREGFSYDQWTLVIPPNESSAVMVATRHMEDVDGFVYTTSETVGAGQCGYTHPNYSDPALPNIEWVRILPWYWTTPVMPDNAATVVTDVTPLTRDVAMAGHIHNAGVVSGTPSLSYTTLFDVNSKYPYFNGTLSLMASYAEWYKGSEGMEKPSGLPSSSFVGWI